MEFRQVTITLTEAANVSGKKLPKSYLWIPEDARLSDLMNDERKFIPVYKENQYRMGEYDMMIVNKAIIAMIEEEDFAEKKKIREDGTKTKRGVRFDSADGNTRVQDKL